MVIGECSLFEVNYNALFMVTIQGYLHFPIAHEYSNDFDAIDKVPILCYYSYILFGIDNNATSDLSHT